MVDIIVSRFHVKRISMVVFGNNYLSLKYIETVLMCFIASRWLHKFVVYDELVLTLLLFWFAFYSFGCSS